MQLVQVIYAAIDYSTVDLRGVLFEFGYDLRDPVVDLGILGLDAGSRFRL